MNASRVAAAELFGPGLPGVLGAITAARGAANPAVAGALLVEGYAQRLVPPVPFRTADHRERDTPYCATCPVTPEADRRRSFHDAVVAFRERTGRTG